MDVLLVAFLSAAFMAVAGIAFAVGQLATGRSRLQRRLPAAGAGLAAVVMRTARRLGSSPKLDMLRSRQAQSGRRDARREERR